MRTSVDLIREDARFPRFRTYEVVDLGNSHKSMLVEVLVCPRPKQTLKSTLTACMSFDRVVLIVSGDNIRVILRVRVAFGKY